MKNNIDNRSIKTFVQVLWFSLMTSFVVDEVKAETYTILQDCDNVNLFSSYAKCLYSVEKMDITQSIVGHKNQEDEMKFGLTVDSKKNWDKDDVVFWVWLSFPIWLFWGKEQKVEEQIMSTESLSPLKLDNKQVERKQVKKKPRKKHMVSITDNMVKFIQEQKEKNKKD